ncbi:4-(cytidine 5'-diphospho)-2-C-methyl-D-erythritol kinase [Oceaniglobus indicus]|uniref:4-(cytidine 5'-diphospho)-2-C-methyl-D-erythritol kinase n=1 Tax=Oceaniglobus indicus TaxID=2047749 RepID=UPI000C182E06|nr:4-(cytidine 5'-diphospho)-2-C-methyl-D-erythritol kinase [Oceaniglobus indicus]
MAEAFAPAKINLTLHITGQRDDGYHLLDSLVMFADVGDRITVHAADEWSLNVTGPMAADVPRGADNLVLRAARLMGGRPAAITLIKTLPTAAGIGGGSADAAATLRALHALDGRPMPADPARLGADVPVCLTARACRMGGIGERIAPLPRLPRLHAVLVNPGTAVATPDVFNRLGRKNNEPMPVRLPDLSRADPLIGFLACQRNDLQAPAIACCPVVNTVLKQLQTTRVPPVLVRMSGSGATCFGLYKSDAAAGDAADEVQLAHPDWWVTACTLA